MLSIGWLRTEHSSLPSSAPLELSRLSEPRSSYSMEQTMFTRQVTMKLRENSAAEFTSIIENEIIPLLRKQKGFRDEVTFVAPGRSEAVANSFWDTKEDAE